MPGETDGMAYQPPTFYERAVYQVGQIESMYHLAENEKARAFLIQQNAAAFGIGQPARQTAPPGVPVHGQVELGNLLELRGLHTAAWHGLGIVGLWAAIDAYCDRMGHEGAIKAMLDGKSPLVLPADLLAVCGELDDLRNLYAHNFAGHADPDYFQFKKTRKSGRYSLAQGQTRTLTSGAVFDGKTNRVHVEVDHLRFYCERAREILGVLNAQWSP